MPHGVRRTVVRHKEEVIRHRALAAAGGLAHKRCRRAVGICRDHRSRAAAVQTQRRFAAKLKHALGNLRQRRADGIAALAAVDGVHHKRAVASETDRRARRVAGTETGADPPVLHELIERADQIRHAVPFAAVCVDGDRDAVADAKRAKRIEIVLTGVEVGRQHVLSPADSRIHAAFHNILDFERHFSADAQLTAAHRADHIIARLARANGTAGIEAVIVHENAERGLADIVHRRNAERIIIRLSADAKVGLSHHGAAVVIKAQGIITAGNIVENAVAHHAAERNTVGRIVIVAVDARDHAPAVRFQRTRRRRNGGELRAVIAARHDGLHAAVRLINHIVFLPEIGISIAPERTGVELGALIDLDV